MNSDRWEKVERIYHASLDKDANERAAFLVQACAGDEALRREVESLLVYEPHAQNFIETPAFEVAVKMVADEHSTPIRAGDRFNQYRILSPLGAGGMGEVYLAEDTSLRRRVALKFLPEVLTKHNAHLRRFEVEARAVAALSHPSVCVIHEVIQTEDDRHCIVMEYIEGMTLRERIAKGDISVNEALDIGIQIASALSSA
ncbi:MAG TPA: protein kinase, partial [Pyrinomonadaceae bacterium]|nr:protein kinase [Pyrinomonadaceae bacterium]